MKVQAAAAAAAVLQEVGELHNQTKSRITNDLFIFQFDLIHKPDVGGGGASGARAATSTMMHYFRLTMSIRGIRTC